MRAALIDTYGQVPSVTDLPEPEGELPTGRMVAAALNPIDLMISGGEYYPVRPKPPYTPGMEGVARREDGSLVYFGRPGDLKHGALAEQVLLDAEQCFPLPAGTEPADAFAAGFAGQAAWLAMTKVGQIKEGERVVITGATGSSGLIAVQLAKLLGAAQIVAVGRDEARLEQAKALGATDTLRFHGPMYLHEFGLKALVEGGHDVTIDFTWGPPAMAALNSGRRGSRLVQVGNAAGLGAGVSATQIQGGENTITGYSIFNEPLAVRREAFEHLLGEITAGRLTAGVETFDFDALPDAWRRQEASPGVKLVTRFAD